VEAALLWTIAKRKRAAGGGFPGAAKVLLQTTKGNRPARKRVGITINGPPARAPTELFAKEEGGGEPTKVVGEVRACEVGWGFWLWVSRGALGGLWVVGWLVGWLVGWTALVWRLDLRWGLLGSQLPGQLVYCEVGVWSAWLVGGF